MQRHILTLLILGALIVAAALLAQKYDLPRKVIYRRALDLKR